MRITRLSLAAYGHFTELALDFPTPAGLHVVLGANEAGKSTALAAIEDALFGFPHLSDAAWRHSPGDLRVGLALVRDDGQARTFWRRKGRKDTLTDESGQPVAEAALAAFLGTVDRARFRRVFGLNDTGLRQGGRAILDGQGDLGESILEAETGLAGARNALASLEKAASGLFGDRRPTRAIWASAGRYEAARHELGKLTVRAPEHERLIALIEELEAAGEAAQSERAALAAERRKLTRIRATTPIRPALRALLAEREALGSVQLLPDDAPACRDEAIAARVQAIRDLAQRRMERLDAADALGSLRVDEAVLAEAASIALVADELSRIEAVAEEIRRLEADREAYRAAWVAAARGLGREPDEVAAPDTPARQRARALLTELPAVQAAVAAAHDAVATRTRQAEELGAEVATADPTAMAAVVEAVRGRGPLEAELGEARRVLARAEETQQAAFRRLPQWTGEFDTLLGLRLPLEADERAGNATLRRALDEQEAARRELAEREREAGRAVDDLRATEAHGAPPSRDALAALRERRDAALAAAIASGAFDAYQGLVREADAAADRRADQAARVEELDRLAMAADRTALAADAARVALTDAQARLEAARARWVALWPPGVKASDADAMREWRRLWGEIVASHEAVGSARQDVAARAAEIERCHARLDAVLPEWRGPLAARLDEADGLLRTARLTLENGRERAAMQRELARETAALAAARDRLAGWQADWAKVTAHLALPMADDLAAAGPALDLWDQFVAARDAAEECARGLAAACQRSGEYDTVLDRLRGLVPGAADIGGRAAAVSLLRAALRTAEDARDERRRLDAAVGDLDGKIAGLERTRSAADDVLAKLCAVAGVADEAGLGEAIRRAMTQMTLDARIAEREAELRKVDDGMSLEALELEAASVTIEPDAIKDRLDEIDQRQAVLETEANERAGRRVTLFGERRAMEERTTVDAAAAMQDEIASMAEDAQRYVRLRLAHALLSAGIERLRRENQDPLLAAAGALFRSLTRDRYEGLVADDADGRTVMLARRADGSTCPVERLSEGTLDQLYLALRLASLERHGAGAERIPLIADDLLASFDDGRARAALDALRRFGDGNQTILFTHHAHIAAMAEAAGASLHHLEVG